MAMTPAWSLTSDGPRFRVLGRMWMEGIAFIPPLYPFFLGVIDTLSGTDAIWPIRIVQSALGGVTILLTGTLARRLAPSGLADRAAILAALLAAFTPPLLLADLTVMSESLAALLTAAFLAATGNRPVRAAGSGLLLGLLALCRAQLAGFVLLRGVLLGFVGRSDRAARRAAIITTLAAVAGIAPWTVRNARVVGGFVPVSNNGGYNFWKSFHDGTTGTESRYGRPAFVALPERELDAAGWRAGFGWIREHPLRAAALAIPKQGYLWGIERLFFIGLRDGLWGPVPWPVAALTAAAIPATQIFWIFFAPAGLILAPASRLRREILMLIGFTMALHFVFNAEARYHVPLLPPLLAAAAVGALSLRRRGRDMREGRLARRASWIGLGLIGGFWAWEIAGEWPEMSRLLGA